MEQRTRNDSGTRSYNPFQLRDGQVVYLSPQGDDAADGTIDSPVKTLERAVSIAQNMQNAKNGVDIYLRGGVYYVSDTINLSYSGQENTPIRISAYKNEKVTVNGGIDISLSEMETASSDFTDKIIDKPADGSILQYNLTEAGITDYGEFSVRGSNGISDGSEAQAELSFGGNVQKLAGWPNDSFTGLVAPTDSSNDGKRTKTGIESGCSFTVDYDRPSQWSKQNEAWLSGAIGYNFAYDYYPMERFDEEEKKVYLKKGALRYFYDKSQHYRFENVPEELDSPGEYYIDRDTGMLYFYPPEGADKNSSITITMSTKNQKEYTGKAPDDLIRLENCDNITFKNIEFKGGRGSGITGKYNENIKFINCDINSFGAHGIRFDYSTGIEIKNSRIHDVGQNGIELTNCGDYTNAVSNGNIIYNNEIYNFARLERGYKAGVILGYHSVGASVLRNHIYNGPHAGLIFYGVNNNICGNEFDNIVTEFGDMDALYANNSDCPWERGNKIHGNYFHDIGRSVINGRHQINVRAIRTDNKGCGLEIYDNLFYRIGDGGTGRGNNNIGAVCAEGTRNRVVNNLFVDCNDTYINNQAYRNITAADDGTLYADTGTINGVSVKKIKEDMESYLPVYGKLFPELYNFFYEHPNMSKTNEFKNNIVINIAFPLSVYNLKTGEVRNSEGFFGDERLTDASGNYVTTQDPGLADYQNGDLGLSQEISENLAENFPDIKMSNFGTIK